MRFPVPGMYGGFSIRLEGLWRGHASCPTVGAGSSVALSNLTSLRRRGRIKSHRMSWTRAVSCSPMNRISVRGYSTSAASDEAPWTAKADNVTLHRGRYGFWLARRRSVERS